MTKPRKTAYKTIEESRFLKPDGSTAIVRSLMPAEQSPMFPSFINE
jgi:hypothetical protein